jgi:hypothetical protein
MNAVPSPKSNSNQDGRRPQQLWMMRKCVSSPRASPRPAASTLIFAVGSAAAAIITDTAAVLAAPLLVADCGYGLDISAQTLTLHEITRTNAGIYETGQRIGMAIGTAPTSALFFGELGTTGGDYHAAAGFRPDQSRGLCRYGLSDQRG